MDELFETDGKKPTGNKHIGHLHRKLFLLVFSFAILAQGWLLGGKALTDYHRVLQDNFKVILTVQEPVSNAQLEEWGQTLQQKQDITQVRLFSPEDALAVVRHKNPQLADSLLQIGKNKMPAYFELTLSAAAIDNIRPFIDNIDTEYGPLVPHYHVAQAKWIRYTGMVVTGMQVLGGLILLSLLAFMFLVEAAPYPVSSSWRGGVAGILAAVFSVLCLAIIFYPLGMLYEMATQFTTVGHQALLIVCSGLLGWTLAKWQRF